MRKLVGMSKQDVEDWLDSTDAARKADKAFQKAYKKQTELFNKLTKEDFKILEEMKKEMK